MIVIGARTAALVVVVAMALALGPTAAAQEPSASTTTVAPAPGGDIIPAPNSGREPQSSGDRGGSAQFILLVVLVGGLATIGGLAWRGAMRARSERAAPTGRRP